MSIWAAKRASLVGLAAALALFVGTASAYQLNWCTITGGGTTHATSTSYVMGVSTGQTAAGEATSATLAMGIGFWYGVPAGGTTTCGVTLTGDVNENGSITSSDIIYLVNYVFKGQAQPLPCEASGDVNCNGSVSASDIIYVVNHVFKGGPEPCDVCTLIPGTWTCP